MKDDREKWMKLCDRVSKRARPRKTNGSHRGDWPSAWREKRTPLPAGPDPPTL